MSGDGGLSFGAATEGYEDDPQAMLEGSSGSGLA